MAAVDPAEPGHYPGCPLLALTGWYCPGCGGLRAVHALTRGDLSAALAHNPLVVVLLPVAAGALAVWLAAAFSRRPLPVFPAPAARALRLLAPVLLAAYWLLRNLL